MAEFFGCMFCSKFVNCQIQNAPAADCPMVAMEKAVSSLRHAIVAAQPFKDILSSKNISKDIRGDD